MDFNKIKTIIKKVGQWIKEFVQDCPGLTFLIISGIILGIVIHYCETGEIVPEFHHTETKIVIEEPEKTPEEIEQETREEISAVLLKVFYGVDYYYSRIITHPDEILMTITYPNMIELYQERNEEIENQVISTYKQIKALYTAYGYPDMRIVLFVEGDDGLDLVYFSVEEGQVDWTCYDPQIKWCEGDDIGEWESNVEGYPDNIDELLANDEEFLQYLKLMEDVKKSKESGAEAIYY